ncbi:hypothetical protein R1sor_017655 [Riccia sorocarpa]|uniref:Uncharacterized protein n=1 Tax=Riccia sorocarpa TaxID=122646 RepID=A0ABD3I7H7_9MARC
MMNRFFSRLSPQSGSSSRATLQGIDQERFYEFYTSLAAQIKTLDDQLARESRFSLAWILSALEFVRSLHSSIYTLIEEVWLPVRKTVGIDVVDTYFGLSVRLLEICNYLRDGVCELEYFQLSLEHCLGTLAGLVASEGDSAESVTGKKHLERCRAELEKMESKTTPNLWLKLKGNSSSSSGNKKQVEPGLSLLERSVSVIPAPSDNKKAFLIAQVMRDVREVLIFICSLLLWVMTDTSEPFSFHSYALHGPRSSPGLADAWAVALFNMRDRIQHSELTQKKPNCALCLKEIRAVYDAVRDLMGKVVREGERREERVADQSDTLRSSLEESRRKLEDMTHISDRLSGDIVIGPSLSDYPQRTCEAPTPTFKLQVA